MGRAWDWDAIELTPGRERRWFGDTDRHSNDPTPEEIRERKFLYRMRKIAAGCGRDASPTPGRPRTSKLYVNINDRFY